MPLKDGRYRVVTTKAGKKVRLHFQGGKGGKVDEAKNLKTGEIHTQEEFMHDDEMEKRRKAMKMPKVGHG